MWYVCDVLYVVVYFRVSCFVVCRCDDLEEVYKCLQL